MKIRKKQIILFIFLFLLAAMIFWFSAQNGKKSGEFSENLTENFLRFFGITDVNDENAERVLRKTAHFVEFLILGALLFGLFLSFKRSERFSGILAFVLSVLYAVLDECHQLFVPDRAASFSDILLDSFGALCGIALVSAIRFFLQKKKC